MKDAGVPFVKEAAMAKLFASQVLARDFLAIEIYGGYGFTKLPRSKVLARRQNWEDLEGHPTATGYHCQAGAR